MYNIELGKSGLSVPTVAVGCMRISEMSEKEVSEFVDTALSFGANFFDHADIYGGGKSEEKFAEAVKALGVRREDMLVQTKCGIRPGLQQVREERISAIRFIFSQQDLTCFENIKALHPENIYRQSEFLPIDGRQISDSSTRYGFYILTADSMDEMLRLLKMSGLEESYFD